MQKPWAELTVRERDAEVARALGWTAIAMEGGDFTGVRPGGSHRHPLPFFTTNQIAAWELVEQFRLVVRPGLTAGWVAARLHAVSADGQKMTIRKESYAEGETPPEAICKAVLRLCGEEVEFRIDGAVRPLLSLVPGD